MLVIDNGVERDATPEEEAEIIARENEAPPKQQRHITILALRNRLTQEEKVKLELASIDNPLGTFEQREQAASLRVAMADAAVAKYADLDLPDVRKYIEKLEDSGLLAAGRASEILDAEIQIHERAN